MRGDRDDKSNFELLLDEVGDDGLAAELVRAWISCSNAEVVDKLAEVLRSRLGQKRRELEESED